ncbi:hypothetical protein BH11PLA2_BH11PLA2_03770 [soil metagenome]
MVHRRLPLPDDRPPSSCILDDTEPSTLSLPIRFGTQVRSLPQSIGAYRILREVGSGGMGVVYEGFDPRLKRRAAIKMIRGGTGLSDDALRRFQTEAEAVAQTQHPNIVQIYEVGWHEGKPFVALEYLSGGSLHAKAANKPQSPPEAAATVRILADAVHHAHTSGVIHRDLKPANVLFTADGIAKITDFGAARLTLDSPSSEPSSAITRVGEVIGTPQYMAPEQARGTPDSITPAVDVYALGALLYHLLTGRPPHDGPDAYDVLTSALQNDPVPPRRLVPKVPRDLETICLKALAKHPAHRYRNAAAMAEDLKRFLEGESIEARPDSAVVRLWKKAKRKPAIAGLILGIVVVSLVGLGGVIWYFNKAVEQATLATHREAIANRKTVEAQNAKNDAESSRDRKESALYSSQISEAAMTLESGDYGKAKEMLGLSVPQPGKKDLRQWEWHYLNRLGNNHLWRTTFKSEDGNESFWPAALAVSPDGKRIAISAGNPYGTSPHDYNWDLTRPAQLFIVNIATGAIEQVWKDFEQGKIDDLRWLDDDRILANPVQYRPKIVRLSTREVLQNWPLPEGPYIEDGYTRARVSPDGKHIAMAVGRRTYAMYNVETGLREGIQTIDSTKPETDRGMSTHTLSNSGWMTTWRNQEHWVIHLPTGRVLTHREEILQTCAFDPTGRYFAIRRGRSEKQHSHLDFYDLQSGKMLWSQQDGNVGAYDRLMFSPDGETIIECYNGPAHVRVKRARDGHHLFEFRGHIGRIWDLVFSPDSRYLATCANDASIRVWEMGTGEEVARYRGHSTGARCLAFAPNSWQIISGGMDGTAIAWDFTRQRADGYKLPAFPEMGPSMGGAFAGGVWFGTDGLARYLDTSRSRLATFDPRTHTPTAVVTLDTMKPRADKSAADFALTADGHWLLGTCCRSPGVPPLTLWDTRTGAVIRTFTELDGSLVAAAISADGEFAAATSFDIRDGRKESIRRELLLWNARTGQLLWKQSLGEINYPALRFRPGSRELYAGVYSGDTGQNGLHVFDLDKPETKREIPGKGESFIQQIEFSNDGRSLVYIDYGNFTDNHRVRRIDLTGQTPEWSRPFRGPITGLAFSPDGRRIATARHDDIVVLWNADDGSETLVKAVPQNRFGDYAFPSRVAFSPDNRSLVANGSNGQLSVWLTDEGTPANADAVPHRYREAEQSAYAFHFRAAWQLQDKPESAAFHFHRDWLDKLLPPNEHMKDEWQKLKVLTKQD